MRVHVRGVSVLVLALFVFGGGVVAGAAGQALLLGRSNDAGSKTTTLSTSATGPALRVTQKGSGAGLVVAGPAGGVGLDLRGGALRVTGAGLNTNTTAFVTTYGPTDYCHGSGFRIDNPQTNGKPDVLIFVTRVGKQSVDSPWAMYRATDAGDCPGGYWYLDGDGTLVGSFEYNILVIKP